MEIEGWGISIPLDSEVWAVFPYDAGDGLRNITGREDNLLTQLSEYKI